MSCPVEQIPSYGNRQYQHSPIICRSTIIGDSALKRFASDYGTIGTASVFPVQKVLAHLFGRVSHIQSYRRVFPFRLNVSKPFFLFSYVPNSSTLSVLPRQMAIFGHRQHQHRCRKFGCIICSFFFFRIGAIGTGGCQAEKYKNWLPRVSYHDDTHDHHHHVMRAARHIHLESMVNVDVCLLMYSYYILILIVIEL